MIRSLGLLLFRRMPSRCYAAVVTQSAHLFAAAATTTTTATFRQHQTLDDLCSDRSSLHFDSCNQSPSITSRLWKGSNYETLLRRVQLTLNGDSMHEAWEAFVSFRRLHGLPRQQQLVGKLVLRLCYSSDRHWLRKAYGLAFVILNENPGLLQCEPLAALCLALARAQMPTAAATIVRSMMEKGKFQSLDIWSALFLHLVKTQIGSYLSAELLIEACDYFLTHQTSERTSKKRNLAKPSITIFNLVLNSLIGFKSTFKAQQILELMSQIGIVADANTVAIIAKIYEMNGELADLKRLKSHIDNYSSITLHSHYQQFYDSLLSLYFKHNDLDAAAELMLELFQGRKHQQASDGLSVVGKESQNQCFLQIGSSNLKTGCKLMVDPRHFENDFIVDLKYSSGLILSMNGKFVPSKKAIAKLVNGCVKDGKINQISSFLTNICQVLGSEGTGICSEVIHASIMLGWLDAAHDILDDLELGNISVGVNVYTSLLSAYCNANMIEESKVLLKQIRKAGFIVNVPDEYKHIMKDAGCSPSDDMITSSVEKANLLQFLYKETMEYSFGSHLLYEFNATILFFCKAKMMEDALNTLKRMKQRNIQPTSLTFSYIINGYSSLKMFREITILWGEIRKLVEDGVLATNRDFLDCLLWNFLRGGYFERVMEIVNYMLRENIHIDKWRYRREFIKLHKNLYGRLRLSDCRTEAQSRRLENVRAFKRCFGIRP